MNIDNQIDKETLAVNLMDYSRDFDTYEFNDCYSSFEEAVDSTKKDLNEIHQVKSLIEMLGNDIVYLANEKGLDDKEMSSLSNRAFKLINQLSVYCMMLEKEKDNNFDIK